MDNSQMSLIEIALNIMEEKNSSENIYTLISEVLAAKGVEDNDGTLTAHLYVDITTSSKFVFMGDDNWDLKSRRPLEDYDKDGSAFISKDEEYKAAKPEEDEDETTAADYDSEYAESENDEDEDNENDSADEEEGSTSRLDAEAEDEEDEEDDSDDDSKDDDYDEDEDEDNDDIDEDKYNDIMDKYEDLYND